MSQSAMHSIEAAIQFARNRGDFTHPVFQQVRSAVPNWITMLGTDGGAANFEQRYQATLPPLLCFYFQNPDIPALIQAGCDLDIFLQDLADCVGGAPPYVIYHAGHAHLVLAFHNHSGGVAAADLSAAESPIRFGDIDADNFDLEPYDSDTVPLASWIDAAIRSADFEQFQGKSRNFPVIP